MAILKPLKLSAELDRNWNSLRAERRSVEEKVAEARKLREAVAMIESEAVRNWSFPFAEVKAARKLLIEIDAYLRRY